MSLLQDYSISKTGKGTFQLNFTTAQDTEVSYSYDSKTNINSIALTAGKNSETKFSKDFKSVNAKLQISFRQNGASKRTLGGDPDVIIEDGMVDSKP